MNAIVTPVGPAAGASGVPAQSSVENPYLKTAKMLLKRAKEVRAPWEPIFQDCYDYALPQREHFYVSREIPNHDRLFDSTALVGTAELASRIQSYLTPVEAKWADLVAGPEVPFNLRPRMNVQLEAVRNYAFSIIHAANFDQQNHEMLLDVVVGSGTMMVVPGDAYNPVRFEAVPMPQLYLLSGPYNETFAWFRCRQIEIGFIPSLWPHADIDEQFMREIMDKPDTRREVIEGVWRDLSAPIERYEHCVFMAEPSKLLYRGEFVGWGSNPFITAHWSKCAGHSWGVGPVQLALPDVKTLNLVQELLLQNAEMGIAGMWQASDDGVINTETIHLVPGTIIPKSMNSKGLEPLEPPGNIELAQFVIEQMRMSVKRALYDEPLGPVDAPVKSATEIDERAADLSRRIGSSSGRLKTEHSQAILSRVCRILVDQGRIELPRIDNRTIKAEIISPLARSQKQEEVVRFTRFAQTLGAISPQLLPVIVNMQRSGLFLAENIGVPPRLLTTEEERQAQATAAAGVAEGLGQAPTGAAEAVQTALGGTG